MDRIETDRLVLRPLQLDDAKDLESVFCNDIVMEFSTGTKTPEWTRNFCREAVEDWYPAWGYGPYCVTDRPSGAVIGYCGLYQEDHPYCTHDSPELGYRLAQKWWGKGIATEAARAVISYSFATLQFRKIIALVDPAHTASVHVLEKIGMKRTGSVMLEGYDHPDYLFEIQRPADQKSVGEELPGS